MNCIVAVLFEDKKREGSAERLMTPTYRSTLIKGVMKIFSSRFKIV